MKRKTFDESGKILREDKDLEITVKPGMKPGSKFKFKGVGDEIDGTTQDVHFIIEEVRTVIITEYMYNILTLGEFRNHISISFVKVTTSSLRLLSHSKRLSLAGLG